MNAIAEIQVSPARLERAVRISQNMASARTVIHVSNLRERFARRNTFIDDLQRDVQMLYKNSTGSFTCAQMSRYSLGMTANPYRGYARLSIDAAYFCSAKELNDLICVACSIAGQISAGIRNPADPYEKVCLLDHWVKENLRYQNTHSLNDHNAIDLIRTGKGVCQSIAALAVMVLHFMSMKALVVIGEGGDGLGGWGPHAWNAILIADRWIHVDFTFGMHSLTLPSTYSDMGRTLFNRTHRYDNTEYNDHVMSQKWRSLYWHMIRPTTLEITGNRCIVSDVDVRFRDPLIKRSDGKELVDLTTLVRMFGGGVEGIPKTGELHVCVCGKQIVLRDAGRYLHNGYLELSILNRIWRSQWVGIGHNTLQIVL